VLAADRSVFDLAEPQAIAGTLDRLAPDIVLVRPPGAMARWTAAPDVPQIHFSTDCGFDGSGERAWQEDDAWQPSAVYGATKLAGENQIHGAGGTSLVVRTFWVCAAEEKDFLRTIARLARERSELRIVADPMGAPRDGGCAHDLHHVILRHFNVTGADSRGRTGQSSRGAWPRLFGAGSDRDG